MAGNTCFVFHESMYSALPTKLMLRGSVSMRNAESRNEMWLGHRIAGPSSGSRSYPAVSMCHSRRATGPSTRRVRCCALPAPAFSVMRSWYAPPDRRVGGPR